RDFQAGQYEKALPVFQNILNRKDVEQWHELAERRIADCLYFLNTETGTGPLYHLVNQYNRLLLKYPDVRPGNDIIYWRLGHLYKLLRNYGQADNAYKRLLAQYPHSSLAEEALYQTGDILRIDKQYAAATAVLRMFYVKYPNSPLSRSAIFSLADSYYNMGLSKEADLWYNTALQRWPDLYGLPEDVFLNAGYHFFSTGNYEKAFRILSYFRNLYPQNRFIPSVTRTIAQCLEKMDQAASAIRLLGRALDKEKDLKESIRIRMMLVEMGAANPNVRTSLAFSSSESYRNPVWGCDQMLADLKNDPLAEEVLYQKGRLLETAKRLQEAYDTYAELLRRYPGSRYLQAAHASAKKIKTDLVNDNYQKQDYLAVANLYFSEKDTQYPWPGDIYYKIADSLKNLGLYEQAIKVFNDILARKLHPDSRMPELAIAQMDVEAGNHKTAQRRLIPLAAQNTSPDATDRKIRRLLADSYYAGGAFDKAASLYAAAMPFDKGDTLAMYRYINSLKRTNQTDLALRHSQDILNDLNAIAENSPIKDKFYLNQAELYSLTGHPEKSIALLNQALPSLSDDFDKRWAEFILTNNYIGTNNPDRATEASSRMRLETNDLFWQRIADYGLNGGLWFTANKDYLE
ncbi:MAG: tetratricopeptide repeat protein, partial [Syntrophobacterales bacterium]|nr:tetratricopeptide repeat protein [Syntrophobacterales bacterium]